MTISQVAGVLLHVTTVGGPWGLVVVAGVALYWTVNNPEKAQIWYSRVAAILSGISRKAELAATAKQVEGSVGLALKEFREEAGALLPQGLKVEWATTETRDAFLRSDEIVVRMRPHQHPDDNYMMSVVTLVENSLLRDTRDHVDSFVMRSLDLLIERKLLNFARRQTLPRFDSQIRDVALVSDSRLDATYQDLCAVDADGLMTTIFLRELIGMKYVLGARGPSDQVREETRHFCEFLTRIATRDLSAQLAFRGHIIKVSVILVALKDKLAKSGPQPYVTRLEQEARSGGIRVIYLCAMGKDNVAGARAVAAMATTNGRVASSEEYHRSDRGIVIAVFPK